MSAPAGGAPLQEYAERLASVFAGAGFPRMPARVLMTLFLSADAALTSAQLTERLDISPAAVSAAVRYLETLGMVRRRHHRGSRRELYELPDHAWYTASLRSNPVYEAIGAVLPEGIVLAEAAEATAPLARLVEMQEFFAFIRARLPELLEEWTAERGGTTGSSLS